MTSPNTNPLRFAILGTGGMGISHSREILARSDATITALCDVNDAALDRAADRLGLSAQDGPSRFTSLDQMLADAPIDAVVIATPHTQHTEHLRKSLQAGKHALCEKPMATTAADARAAIQLAEQNNLTLAIAYQRHGEARYKKAYEIVTSGMLGELRLINVLIAQDCLRNFLPGATWRADPALSGGGHFMDTGSHIVDMMLWVSGLEPQHVYAEIDNHATHVDVITALSMRFTNGARGVFAATSLSAEPWREELSFYGTEGVLNIRTEGLSYQLKNGDKIYPRTEGRNTRPIEDFIATVCGETKAPQAPAIYGLRVAQITEAAYKSAHTGRPESVG